MVNPDLEKYIQAAKNQNISDGDIKYQLKKIGWDDRAIDEALMLNTSTLPPPPPPPPATHFGMWVTFQYVILFISLYVSATALGGIFYLVVDKFFSSPSLYTNGYYSQYSYALISGYASSLIVAYPVFACLFVILNRQATEKPAVKQLRARKQLIYITMILTFVIMIFQLITTLNGLLNGETTLRSVGYFGVTLLIAGTIFIYLLFQVKEDRNQA